MKTTLIAATAFAACASSAMADNGIGYFGQLEWAPEQDTVKTHIGIDYMLDDNLVVYGQVNGGKHDSITDGQFEIVGYEFKAEYHTSDSTKIFAIVEVDQNFDNDQYRLGASFNF